MHFEEFPSTVDLAGSYAETSQNVLSDMKEGAQALAEYPGKLASLITSVRARTALLTPLVFALLSSVTTMSQGVSNQLDQMAKEKYLQDNQRPSIAALVDCSEENPGACLSGADDCMEGVNVVANGQIPNPEAILAEFNTFSQSDKEKFEIPLAPLYPGQVNKNGYLVVDGKQFAAVEVGKSSFFIEMDDNNRGVCAEYAGKIEDLAQVKKNEGDHPVQLASNL